jgi:hypothetical protein
MCKAEAVELPTQAAELIAETGLAFSPILLLFEDRRGNPPDAEIPARYAEDVGLKGFPVTADPDQDVFDATPYDGGSLPGVCALGPDMTLIDCSSGSSAVRAMLDAVKAHAGFE